ncbi:MAG: hypothetical protein DHS20C17_02120 [Cyclobacteriaceae bacterium]|nr:MAG: hypothetical protein DHS20C17_02120 [Cyclobacteriaceae bacterium]
MGMIISSTDFIGKLVVSQFDFFSLVTAERSKSQITLYCTMVKTRSRDTNERAKQILDIATGEAEDKESKSKKNPKGRAGGLKGGKARAKKLTANERSEIARKAAKKRWGTN